MKIGIITFHAAHNFGSMLQAYALKNFLNKYNNQNEVVNYRTDNQKDIYAVITKRKGIKYLVKNMYSLINYISLNKKHKKFEEFINHSLKCGNECRNSEMINRQGYDVIISGSDQIWNINTNDFEWVYLLEGIDVKRKYSYAASCGPGKVNVLEKVRIEENLEKYNAISVRDNATKNFVTSFSSKKAEIVCDPVFLLTKQQWSELAVSSTIKLPEKYIFFYTLSCSKRMKEIVQQISKILNLPIVIPHDTNQNDLFMKAKRRSESGPIEFLHMIKNADVVVTSSFHAMLFSIIFNKQFYIIDGLKDNRKKDLLLEYSLQKQSIEGNVDIQMIRDQYNNWKEDFSAIVESEQRKGSEFIRRNIFNEDM